jgi:plasmid stabilization system protein ParE
LAWKLGISHDAQADLRDITVWLSQRGAGVEAARKLAALKAGLLGLRRAPFRHPAFEPTGGRKCSTRGGHEIHYDVRPDPAHSTTSGRVEVLFVKGPLEDYTTFIP